MSDAGAPPVIPTSLQVYDSYAIDPEWQKYFTYTWTAAVGLAILLSVPYLVNAARSGDLFRGYFIQETLSPSTSTSHIPSTANPPPLGSTPKRYNPFTRVTTTIQAIIQSMTLLSIPSLTISFRPLAKLSGLSSLGATTLAECCRKSYLSLTVGQMFLVLAYAAVVGVCIRMDAQLSQNSNRAGFLALAQLTPLMLLATKNNPLGLILGLGYEKLNFAHRWAGRIIWISATIHGGLWINQFLATGQRDQIVTDKSLRGIASWILLTALAVTSLKPIRKRWYQVFFILHIMSFVGFFAAISYHTPYSRPWIYPPIALYAADLFLRLLRYRVRDAVLVPLGGGLTMIHVPDCDKGWLPTQHIWIRILARTGIWESHPFTITNAPPSSVEGLESPRGIIMYSKECGGWTRRLRRLAEGGMSDVEEKEGLVKNAEDEEAAPGCQVKVILDGPYGGLTLDVDKFGVMLLIAGGSGVTFMLGCIEECLRKGVNGGGPRRIECAWVVQDMETIESLASTLAYLHEQASKIPSLNIIYNLYLTRPPRPLPSGPPPSLPSTTTLHPYRPSISQLVQECLPPPTLPELEEGKGMRTCCSHGGVLVVACGPESIVAESRNAVAGLGLGDRVRAGGVEFFGECYSI